MTPWLDQAIKYLGQHEIPGPKDNQFILDCFKFTGYVAGHDEVPWCAAFVCRVLHETGYRSTGSAAAASYANYGVPTALESGAIVVFKWASGAHHVSICHHVSGDYVACLGGNQSNEVRISVFNKKYVVASRWPTK